MFIKFFNWIWNGIYTSISFCCSRECKKSVAPKAISIILLGGIVSAFIGPNLANYTKGIVSEYLYVGSYLSLSILTLIPIIFLFFYKDTSKLKINIKYSGRSYLELISQPRFLQAIIAAAFGYAIMTFLMTATPISMHIMEKISLTKTSIVIQLHVVAMFLPSLITGYLIKKYGHSNIMYAGVFLFSITIIVSFLKILILTIDI